MTSPLQIAVNARVLDVPSNGQKRVAEELLRRLEGVEPMRPGGSAASGLAGHLWEQVVLPARAAGRPLWSPSTSGPLLHPNHIVTIHDIAFVDGPEWFSPSFRGAYRRIVGGLVRSSRHLVTVSEFTRRRVIEHYDAHPDKVTAIHSGISRAFFPRDPAEVERFLARVGLGRCRYIVAFSGTDPRKNTARVLRAWASIGSRHPDARLVTFGRASNPKVFSSDAPDGEVPGVLHLPLISDDELACLYAGSAGLVFPSLYEGFGLPVVEAAACGCRIVTSATSALPEVSPPDAVLLEPLSINDVAAAMTGLLDSEDSADARSRRTLWAQRFDWDDSAMRYARLFERHFD